MAFATFLPIIGNVLDRVLPDKAAREKAQLELLAMQQGQEIKLIDSQLSAIISEANSKDPWTSRARPSFLYVVYILMLSAIPMGVLNAFNPEMAANITIGFKSWMDALPEPVLTLFGVGYLGYTGARSFDKSKGNTK